MGNFFSITMAAIISPMVKNTMPSPNHIRAYEVRPLGPCDLYHRVKAYGLVSQWIEQQSISLWKHDDDDGYESGLGLRSRYLLMPELVTLLQLRWA